MEDLDGIYEFEADLSENFNVFLSGRATDALGGGLYELVMTVLHNQTVHDFLLYSSGVATELIKDEAKNLLKNFIAFPIKKAYEKLKLLNADSKLPSIERVEVYFKDIRIFIYNVYPNGIDQNLDLVLDLLEVRLSKLVSNGEYPSYIYIPVFEDEEQGTHWSGQSVFRRFRDVDETITNITAESYLTWGLFYSYQPKQQCKVYKARTKELINVHLDDLEFGKA